MPGIPTEAGVWAGASAAWKARAAKTSKGMCARTRLLCDDMLFPRLNAATGTASLLIATLIEMHTLLFKNTYALARPRQAHRC